MNRWHNPNIISFAGALPDIVSGQRTPREFLERCLDVIADSPDRRTLLELTTLASTRTF